MTCARFWAKVNKEPGQGPEGECWEWIANRNKGYGHFVIKRKVRVRAHRVAFFLEHGRWPIPFGCHTCDNCPCCNPAHIFEGTHQDNMQDMVAKGRSLTGGKNPAHCQPETRPRGECHFRAKFSDFDVLSIRQRQLRGDTRTLIARDYNVSPSTIGRIVAGKTWGHVQ